MNCCGEAVKAGFVLLPYTEAITEYISITAGYYSHIERVWLFFFPEGSFVEILHILVYDKGIILSGQGSRPFDVERKTDRKKGLRQLWNYISDVFREMESDRKL